MMTLEQAMLLGQHFETNAKTRELFRGHYLAEAVITLHAEVERLRREYVDTVTGNTET